MKLSALIMIVCAGCATGPTRPAPAPVPRVMRLEAAPAAGTPAPGKILVWTYPQQMETPDLVFNVYHTSDLTVPLRQWPLLVTVPGTARSVAIAANQPHEFLALSASNSLGEEYAINP